MPAKIPYLQVMDAFTCTWTSSGVQMLPTVLGQTFFDFGEQLKTK